MSEIKYDPELPFAVVIEDYPNEYVILGRCSTLQYAEDLLRKGTILRKIIDTTPKPKIPEDAEYISWRSYEMIQFAYRYENGEWAYAGDYWTLEGILKEIGDSEVTVLVRKEET